MDKGIPKEIDFVKMHGAGNDYVYINCTADARKAIASSSALPELARAVSDRHFGIGGDGMVLILRGEETDFEMRMFNSDGSEAQMCGNASRCVGKYVYDAGLTDKTEVTLLTGAGVKTLFLHVGPSGQVDSVTVDMGRPVLTASDIPVRCDDDRMIRRPIEVCGELMEMTAVSMGNPHGVIFVNEITDRHVLSLGPELEKHPVWPEKANIEFVQVLDSDHVRMRVWERGTGETLACGTGSCATVVASVLCGLTSRKVSVDLVGGRLTIDWDETSGHVFMTGPAATVATGIYRVPAFISGNSSHTE